MSSAAPPLDDENLLSEILLRLPPQPSSLPRASAVCKRLLRLVSDPGFIRRFRRRHRRNPPLLGCFIHDRQGISYEPTMDSPDRVPAGRFSFQLDNSHRYCWFLGCRHGLVLTYDPSRRQVLVLDPVTRDQHRLDIPPGFDGHVNLHGAVLRAAGEVHHFQVVLVEADGVDERALACVYSSETDIWANLVSTSIQSEGFWTGMFTMYFTGMTAVLVRNSLYWLLHSDSFVEILEFNLERQSLAVIQVPVDMFEKVNDFTVIRAEGGGLGLLLLSNCNAQLWKRNTDCDDVASWGMGRTIGLDKLLSQNLAERPNLYITGYAEENNVVFLSAVDGVFMVQLESLQFKKLHETNEKYFHHQFESVYTAGIGDEHDGAELVHNT